MDRLPAHLQMGCLSCSASPGIPSRPSYCARHYGQILIFLFLRLCPCFFSWIQLLMWRRRRRSEPMGNGLVLAV